MTEFSYDLLLLINKIICSEAGEESIVINEDNIRSALGVQHSYYETDEEVRVAMFHHLIVAHGFKDGNKRTALVALLYDGELPVSDEELYEIAIEVAGPGGSHIPIRSLVNRIFKK